MKGYLLSALILLMALGLLANSAYGAGHSLDAVDGAPVDVVYVDNDGKVGIGTNTPFAKLHVEDGNILGVGVYGSGAGIPVTGAGTRLLWYPKKAAFRAGYVPGTQWDDANIGHYSTAMGYNTTASGYNSTAMGANTTASGDNSTAMGYNTTASGSDSTAIGQYLTAGTENTIVLGQGVSNTNRLDNNTPRSLMVGFNSNIPTLFVGPSAGAGTTGKVGIGTTEPKLNLQLGDRTGIIAGGAAMWSVFSRNQYYSAGDKRLVEDEVARVAFDANGNIQLQTAPSGVADSVITWTNAMTILNSGKVGIGTTSPATSAKLEIASTTGALLVPRMTTAQRDALTAVNGMIMYNTNTNAFNFRENGAWVTK